jgi:hypothetical protein
VVVIERGTVVYRGASGVLLQDQAALDRLVGLDLRDRTGPGYTGQRNE